jgi:diadenosine tetraphosphatase ApaH/serine/threonine PP2A family protein phosphatase
VFSVHGGSSPGLPFIERINLINRKTEIPEAGLLADLTWSDPDGNRELEWKKNKRGAGWIFGKTVVERFNHVNRIRLITRSHQLVREGYQWMFEDPKNPGSGRLITVWSAPNYAYTSGNLAKYLKVRCGDEGDGLGTPQFRIPQPDSAVTNRILEENVKPDERYFS